MRLVLNVAEKPSVAKSITNFLSGGQSRYIEPKSKYNPIYEFNYAIQGEPVLMRVTSVQGHVMTMEFEEGFTN